MNELNFYKALKLIVAHSQRFNDKHHGRLNAFAVLRSIRDSGLQNLSKSLDYKYSDYFFSRHGQQLDVDRISTDFPLLAVLPEFRKWDKPFGVSRDECNVYRLSILYPHLDQTGIENCPRCIPLKVEEVYSYMADHLRYLLSSIRDLSVLSNGEVMPKKIFDLLQGAGQYAGVTEDRVPTANLRKHLTQNNATINVGYHDDIGAGKLCGVEVVVRICDCLVSEYTPSLDQETCCPE